MSENEEDLFSFSLDPASTISSYIFYINVLNDYGKHYVEVAAVYVLIVLAAAFLWLRSEKHQEEGMRIGVWGCITAAVTCILTSYLYILHQNSYLTPCGTLSLSILFPPPSKTASRAFIP